MTNNAITFSYLDLPTTRIIYNAWYNAISTVIEPSCINWVEWEQKIGDYCDSNDYKFSRYKTKKNANKPEIVQDEITIIYNRAKKDNVVIVLDVGVVPGAKLTVDNMSIILTTFIEYINNIVIIKDRYICKFTNIDGKRINKATRSYGGGKFTDALRAKLEVTFVPNN